MLRFCKIFKLGVTASKFNKKSAIKQGLITRPKC